MTNPVPLPEKLHVVKYKANPGSDAWCQLVTASKVAGIVGESNYSTPYAVHCLMNGHREDISGMADRFNAGHAFEPAMAHWLELNHPDWRLSRGEVQVTNPHLPFANAATPDRIATNIGRPRNPRNSRTVQFKTVQDWEEWSNLTDETLPAEWLIQVTWEMLVSGLTQNPAILFALGPYYSHQEFEIHFDPEFAAALLARVIEFRGTLDGPPPAPTAPRDFKIAKLRHPDIDDEADPAALTPELAAAWNQAKVYQKAVDADARKAKAQAETVGAQVLEAMAGVAEATTPDGLLIATRTANKNGVVSLKFKDPAKPAPKSAAA